MNYAAANIQTIQADWLLSAHISLDILRIDKIHPVVSGNKWFKLKYYLDEALQQGKTLATFGGAWSNHIVAVAFSCHELGIKSIGIIRGERSATITKTLQSASDYGMELHFVSREDYRNKNLIKEQFASQNLYWINEGGYGNLGALGAGDIGIHYDLSAYSHIIAGVGTGTMLAGLILSAKPHQSIIGISAMKGNNDLESAVSTLINAKTDFTNFTILHDYHFGGFGKHPRALLDFMNGVYDLHHLPLDIVYTGKVFYAIKDLAQKGYFKSGDKLLMLHSGGLQGNLSLPQKLLAF